MNELEFQEEWLSAYLDDELTDEQRLVVEQRLATDPAAQAILDDLQRVRSMVAKLPNWSGRDLNFSIPNEAPGSTDEVEDEFVEGSDDDLEDFEEAPRLIDGADELRGSEPRGSAPNVNWNSNSQSNRSMLGWIAMAASVLLVAGLGYFYWPPAPDQVAIRSSNLAPSAADKSKSGEAMQAAPLQPGNFAASSEGTAPSSGSHPFEFDAADASKDDRKLAEQLPTAPLTKRFESALPSRSIEQAKKETVELDRKESKMKADSNLLPADPAALLPPAPSQALADGSLGGLGGGVGGAMRGLGTEQDMQPRFGPNGRQAGGLDSAGSLAADAPVAELPPPSPANSPSALGAPVDNPNGLVADGTTRAKSQNQLSLQNSLPAAVFYFARSQSWMDEEAKSSLPYGANEYSANQLAFGYTMLQRSQSQNEREAEAEVSKAEVLMAGIKPEVANSPEFFQTIVNSNNLVAIEQQPANNQLANSYLQGSNFGAVANRDAAAANVPLIESANSSVTNMFSNQRSQNGAFNATQASSYVLFLNRDEASQILNGLQEKGQVTSQVWQVVKQPETQLANGGRQNMRGAQNSQNATTQDLGVQGGANFGGAKQEATTPQSAAAPQLDGNSRSVADPRTDNGSLNRRSDSTANGQVILLLNGPPQ